MNKKLYWGYAMVITSAILYGCMGLITTHIYQQDITRETAVFMRNFLAIPFLAVLAWKQHGFKASAFRICWKTLPMTSAIALLGCCITPLLLFSAYNSIGTGPTTVFHFIYPALVVLLSWLFLRKTINGKTVLALVICIGGIALFYNPADPLNLTGCGLALLSGLTYAVYVVLLSVFKNKDVSSFKLSFYVSVICAAAMLAICLVTDTLTLPTNATGWLLCILLALVVNVGAMVLFQQGTAIAGGERASILSTAEPLTSMITGYLFLGETGNLNPRSIIGSVLVIAASILIAVADKGKAE
ncbi:MAG: hypothetical protein E7437_01185 [Ruminococcaceae bacterium]|nr:hypothetical protein [Oscillospiraceae bacterium]